MEKGYEQFMDEVREEIKNRYGSVYSFCLDKTIKKKFTEQELKGVPTIISTGSNSKSFPMLKKLYKLLFNRTLEQKIKIQRTQIITIKD